MLALERRATVLNSPGKLVRVKAQPFGGAIRILNPVSLRRLLGELRFDSERSRREQDFRILIRPAQWDAVKQYCLNRLADPDDPELESHPNRELSEELGETLGVELERDQYTLQPIGFVIEDHPVPTDHAAARGRPTVRLYRTFEVNIVDRALCELIQAASERYSDQELAVLALNDVGMGGPGHANSILSVPLDTITAVYLARPEAMRYTDIAIGGHRFDESVLVILDAVNVAQYQRA